MILNLVLLGIASLIQGLISYWEGRRASALTMATIAAGIFLTAIAAAA